MHVVCLAENEFLNGLIVYMPVVRRYSGHIRTADVSIISHEVIKQHELLGRFRRHVTSVAGSMCNHFFLCC